MDQLILSNVSRFISLSEEEEKRFIRSFETQHVPKRTKIVEQDSPCQNFYFVASGSLRAYHLNSDGKECTLMFAIEDWWITDMDAFINSKAASLTLETLEDSHLYSISLNTLNDLLASKPQLEKYFRILFQRAYVREQRRALDSISLPVEERFASFTKKYPNIIKKVTQKQIASYLGVTPEFLCMVKNKLHS